MPNIIMLLTLASCLHAQSAFEAASVRRANPDSQGVSLEILPGGRLTATNVSLRDLLKEAYRMRDFQIEAAPSWFDSQRFDVAAKAPGAAEKEQVRRMLQALLADRFQLVLRRESKELQVYVLTAGKNGPHLRDAADGEGAGGVRIRGSGKLTGTRASAGELARALSDIRLNGSAILDRPVIDRTGLTGIYDFSLEWTPDVGFSDAADRTGPSIFTAIQEQLGLKLEKQKAPVEIFIIDHVEKPTAN